MRSKLLSNVFTLMMMTAAVSSCEKMTLSESVESENGEKGNVVLRVTQFEQTCGVCMFPTLFSYLWRRWYPCELC